MKLSFIKKIRDNIEDKLASISEAQRKKIIGYIYISLTLFTFSFFGIFAIAPTLTTIGNLNKQYEDSRLVLDALNQKLTNLQLLDFQYQEIQPEIPKIYAAIPRTTQIPTLARKLENLAQNNNLTVSRLSFGKIELYPNKKNEPIYSFTFTIIVAGTQASVNNFMGEIIDFDRIVGIQRIVTGLNENDEYSATITGEAYFSEK